MPENTFSLKSYKNISILLINCKLSSPESFSFNKKNNSDMEKEIKLLNIKKATHLKTCNQKF